MPLFTYLYNFDRLRDELFEDLGGDNALLHLSQALRKIGKAGWIEIVYAHKEQAVKYLSQTPGQRKKRPLWKTNLERGMIILSACYFAKKACVLVSAADRVSSIIGSSYRDALSFSAVLSEEVIHEMEALWPFPDYNPWEDSDADSEEAVKESASGADS
ncbi:hypothetical protein [uncultured Bilophila sp.]|uniref:hypothetical protein n=1 Tax=uncultured Bilophila sp. TaxID=529385 RepID=UPI0026DB6627|nr:hypothetical protein [uncultured Bilophila sp.]